MGSGLSRFLAELRRRRVLPTAVGYALVGLGLVEGADIVVSRLSLFPWIVDFVLWAVLLGFPAALVLSWFFDFSAEGVQRTPELAAEERHALESGVPGAGTWVLVSVAALVVLISGYLALSRGGSAATSPAGTVPVALSTGDAPRRVLVLPFRNLGSPEMEYFVAGMASELRRKLDMVEGLRVIPATSSEAYRDSNLTLSEIGRELGVEFILEGEVQRQPSPSGSGPDRVRVSLGLYRALDEDRVWGQPFERDYSSDQIFRLQNDIAERVAEGAGVALGREVDAVWVVPPTENMEAHDAWLEGRSLAGDVWSAGIARRKLALFQRAVDLDPGFWWAWADVSQVKSFLGRDGSSEELCREAREALERATALAGDDPTIHYFQAWYLYRCPNDYDGALAELELIASVMPEHYYSLLALIYRRQGKPEAYLQAMLHAFDLDPRSANKAQDLSVHYASTERRFQEALEWTEKGIEADPYGSRNHLTKGFLVMALTGDADSARAVWKRGQDYFDPGDTLYHQESLFFDFWARDTAAVLDRMERWEAALRSEGRPVVREILIQKGTLMHAFGRPEEARVPLDSARILFEPAAEQGTEDAWVYSGLSQAYAGLGRREEALRAAGQAVEVVSSQGGRPLAEQLNEKALTQVMLGDYSEAIETLEAVRATGAGYFSSGRLRAEAFWDPLRDHPRFQALLAAYDADLEEGG
jgi:TolB-like protein/tetratricopeptide (TPR) repeat protein